ncbi:Chemotaxis protein CheW [Rubripirellula obstinata]|uniref:Chemotaxis protein CheW n=1 Tax=Rubripirellula obstinata TaxID=406547 RepID=A0A5B1CC36_9BACT|nr:chemotaxis protein CheW [Rubripirellula obstinata]KAA1257782.1 Chemotaxis protein CheW [Rubripirellula obstinata]
MTTTTQTPAESKSSAAITLATFYVDNMLFGVNIDVVQEINRLSDVTEVPHSPSSVRGVINLRGEVVTVVDLRSLLGMKRREIESDCRCVVIHSQDELIGVLVDQIADTLSVPQSKIDPPPANIDGIEGQYFRGVHTLDSGVVILLDVQQLLEAN